ncbi:DUF86 domain-containing protein [Candidatus Sumerlaeota bacterium]|nr:DUF86 domain-containing protein [Candidatus Sumerlaeota bacterium]
MSNRADCDLLKDIRESVRRIRMFTDEMTCDRFLTDIKTQDAVIRNLEIIGEATKNLSQVIRGKYPDLPWKGMAGIRDRLIHHYFGVNLDIVWDIVAIELSDLEPQIEAILKQESR